MPIKTRCECGQPFVADESLIGKSVPCSACSQLILIPASSIEESSDLGNKAAPCPSCKEPFPSEKAVCPNCAYSRRLKRRMKKKNLNIQTVKPKSSADERKAKPNKKKEDDEPFFDTRGMNLPLCILGMIIMLASVGWFALMLQQVGKPSIAACFVFFSGFGMLYKGLGGEGGWFEGDD